MNALRINAKGNEREEPRATETQHVEKKISQYSKKHIMHETAFNSNALSSTSLNEQTVR